MLENIRLVREQIYDTVELESEGLVDFMTVYSKEDISVTFKDGTEIHMG